MDLTYSTCRVPNIDETWLSSLPYDDQIVAAAGEGIRLSALLVSAPPERVKLLVGPVFIEFNATDVLKIEELLVPPESRLSAAIAVDLVLRVGARVLAIYAADGSSAVALGGPLPFSLATRPTALMLPPSPKYRTVLTQYMQRYHLEPEP